MTQNDFMGLLSQDSNDWTLRSVYADRMEELGEQDLAECIRWMVKHEKRPLGLFAYHCWYNEGTVAPNNDTMSDIPAVVFNELSGYSSHGNIAVVGAVMNIKEYTTRLGAEMAFYDAWLKTKHLLNKEQK